VRAQRREQIGQGGVDGERFQTRAT
jgi:hypothetical protein